LTSRNTPVKLNYSNAANQKKRGYIMEKKVLVPVAQGIEEMEAITIIDVLRRAGTNVIVASVDEISIKASKGIEFKADTLLKDCMDEKFDLIALPGGIPGA